MPENLQTDVIMLFDGYCKFCSGSAMFVLHRSRGSAPNFCAMQSDRGQSLLRQLELPLSDYETFALVDKGTLYFKSDGVIRLTSYMRPPWPVLGEILATLPKTWRDWIYDIVAANRYRLLGRRNSCMIPDEESRARFLE